MTFYDEVSKSGNYTAYIVPPAQSECSRIWMHNSIDKLVGGWYGAIEIFDTPKMTIKKLMKLCPLRNAKQGELLRWLRNKYEVVYKNGEFYFDKGLEKI